MNVLKEQIDVHRIVTTLLAVTLARVTLDTGSIQMDMTVTVCYLQLQPILIATV